MDFNVLPTAQGYPRTITEEIVHKSDSYAVKALLVLPLDPPQWGAADAQSKVPSVENTELEGSRFKAWGMSVYSYICYANCQEFLPC